MKLYFLTAVIMLLCHTAYSCKQNWFVDQDTLASEPKTTDNQSHMQPADYHFNTLSEVIGYCTVLPKDITQSQQQAQTEQQISQKTQTLSKK